MKATTAVALVGFTAIQQVNAAYDCSNAPTGDPNTQCGRNECCSTSEQCSGLTNTGCPAFGNPITVSCWACCGNPACDKANGATVGVRSCNGDNSCNNAYDSNIGDHSCRADKSCESAYSSKIGNDSCIGFKSCQDVQLSAIGDQSCVGEYSCYYLTGAVGEHSCLAEAGCSFSDITIGYNSCNTYQGCYMAYGATIGSNSCNGGPNIRSCWHCQKSNIPSNECNYLKDGWDDSNGQYYNYCIYCSNCKDQATGQSCYVSVLSSTVHAMPSSTNENDTDCKKLNETITEAFKAMKNEALKEFIGKYVKSEIEEHHNLCTIKLALMFEHLNKDKLEHTCEALQTFFSNHVEEFKNNHPRFTEMIFSCEPKDQNANVGKDPKKSKNGKNTKKSKKNGKKEKKRIRKHSKALVAQFVGA
eukprot:CAMPEP_0172422490 /NCGR_PEP_ID=MMETSP1064-20121228/8635_1 /TAXON_ID=202472 /ORGANISM="Aulacoseira subarctica , Strain CCAP 1002/5" /LENGTH=415 /DNA_ID=CAMNT_0013163371 /DNA_START=207 /DNA_END=1454 /DNA_ORIENTATION=-